MPYNRMYNELLPPENETMSDLTRTLIGIQMRREEKQRQAKLDALFEERQRQMMQMAQDEQALKIAEIQQRATAATPEAQLPTVPKTTSEGAFLNPDEAAYAGVEAPPSGFVKTGETTSDVPDVSPLTVNLSNGRSVTLGRQSLEGTRTLANEDFMAKLPEMIAAGIAGGHTMASPETGPYGVVPASVGAAQKRVPTIPGFRDVTVDGKRALLTNEQISTLQANGNDVLDYDKPTAGTGLAMKQYTDKRSGEVIFLNQADAAVAAKERWLAPGPTSEMRNTSYQAGAVEPAYRLANASLDDFDREQGGIGMATQLIPGSKAYFARTRFTDQAKALLGAIVARQAGEGSRLSDEDRKVYAQAATLVNGAIMLPGGVKEARARLKQSEDLINVIQQRRAISGAGAGAGAVPPPPGGAQNPQGKQQRSKKTGEYRHSLDGGASWQPGPLPQ